MATFAIRGGCFVMADGLRGPGYLLIEDGKISAYLGEKPRCEVVDRGASWVAPGFVDTHIHGFGGHDVMDCDPKGLLAIARDIARHGTTSWLPTTLTSTAEKTRRACEAVAEASRADDPRAARIQGIFLEGPFFSGRRAGAQNAVHMCEPDVDLVLGWQEASGGLVRKSSHAPELSGSQAFARSMAKRGIVSAIGHSDATYDEALAAIEAGSSVFVHTFNAMSGLGHREPGMVGAAFDSDAYCELICDGLHVHPAAVRALCRAKGWGRVALVTDCLCCGGMPDGDYLLGDLPIRLDGGEARLLHGGNLAGSTLTLDQAVRNVVLWGVATPEQALRMASEVPARSCGIDDRCGVLAPGRAADVVLLDEGLNLADVLLDGVSVLG